MNEPAPVRRRGISKGAFLALFLIPCVLTYIVGWVSPLLGLATAGVGYVLARTVIGGLYIWMAVASFMRGTANGKQWAVVLPLVAGIFDVFLVVVPLVPSVFNVVALVVGVGEAHGRPAGGESALTSTDRR